MHNNPETHPPTLGECFKNGALIGAVVILVSEYLPRFVSLILSIHPMLASGDESALYYVIASMRTVFWISHPFSNTFHWLGDKMHLAWALHPRSALFYQVLDGIGWILVVTLVVISIRKPQMPLWIISPKKMIAPK